MANRIYNIVSFGDNNMRQWVGVVNTDNVICSGFSSLLTKVCSETFEPSEVISFAQSSSVYDKQNKLLGDHANNLVLINDKKYHICGCYHSDSCWCSPKEKVLKPLDDNTNFNYCLIPLRKLLKSTKYKFIFANDLFIYKVNNAQYIEHLRNKNDAQKDTIDNYILDYFGYKSSRTLFKEISPEYFNRLKKNLLKEKLESIKEKFLANQPNAKKLLNKKVPTLLVLNAFKEKDNNIALFLENLKNLVNNKKWNKEFIFKMIDSQTFENITKQMGGFEDSLGVYNVEKMLENAIINYNENNNDILNNIYENYICSLIDCEINKFTKKNKKIIDPKPIKANLYKKPFKILASFIGIKDEREIKDFVDRKLAETKKLEHSSFAGIFEPVEETAPINEKSN